MPARQHAHKFKRHKYKNGSFAYFCLLDCTFKIDCELAEGLKAVCNLCGNEFIMDRLAVRLKYPHCVSCSKKKITTTDGTVKFIRKKPQSEIVTTIATDSAADLAHRLKSSISTVLERDEDI